MIPPTIRSPKMIPIALIVIFTALFIIQMFSLCLIATNIYKILFVTKRHI